MFVSDGAQLQLRHWLRIQTSPKRRIRFESLRAAPTSRDKKLSSLSFWRRCRRFVGGKTAEKGDQDPSACLSVGRPACLCICLSVTGSLTRLLGRPLLCIGGECSPEIAFNQRYGFNPASMRGTTERTNGRTNERTDCLPERRRNGRSRGAACRVQPL